MLLNVPSHHSEALMLPQRSQRSYSIARVIYQWLSRDCSGYPHVQRCPKRHPSQDWRSELPFKRWHHQISPPVVLLLNSPWNKLLNSQRKVSFCFFPHGMLTPWITLLQAVDFHWHYNYTFILSSPKRCLLTTWADLAPPGLTSSLPPFTQPQISQS